MITICKYFCFPFPLEFCLQYLLTYRSFTFLFRQILLVFILASSCLHLGRFLPKLVADKRVPYFFILLFKIMFSSI